MTGDRFDAMNEQEQRELARRLADASNVLDFETALRVVRFDSAQAEELLRNREEEKKTREEFARIREERRLALLELR